MLSGGTGAANCCSSSNSSSKTSGSFSTEAERASAECAAQPQQQQRPLIRADSIQLPYHPISKTNNPPKNLHMTRSLSVQSGLYRKHWTWRNEARQCFDYLWVSRNFSQVKYLSRLHSASGSFSMARNCNVFVKCTAMSIQDMTRGASLAFSEPGPVSCRVIALVDCNMFTRGSSEGESGCEECMRTTQLEASSCVGGNSSPRKVRLNGGPIGSSFSFEVAHMDCLESTGGS